MNMVQPSQGRIRTNEIDAKVYGSVDASNKGAVDRDKIREILGAQVIQKLQLK